MWLHYFLFDFFPSPRNWNVTEQTSLYISSTFACNKFILRKPHETKIRFHNLFPLKSLHSFRFAYFCFNVTPSGYSHFYPGFLNRIPVRLAIRGGGTSLTAHTHTNKLWIPPKYTHKYLVCILHPHSPPLLLCVWYFLGYFNHASYEIPTDSSISGSLHVTVAMDNDFFFCSFFYFIGPIFPLDFPVARNHANFEDASAYTDGLVGGLGGRIFRCEDRFLSCFVWKDTSKQTHTKKQISAGPRELRHGTCWRCYQQFIHGFVLGPRVILCSLPFFLPPPPPPVESSCWRFCAREKFEKINQHESWRRRDKRRKNLRITTALPVEDSAVDPTLVARGGSRSPEDGPEDDDTKPWRCPSAIPQETLQVTWATKD